MKNNICFVLFFTSYLAVAQNYRIFYKMSYKPDSTASNMYSKDMLLDIDEKIIKFHSFRMYESDSIYESKSDLEKEQIGKFIDYEHMVIKNKEKGEMLKFYKISFFNIFNTKEKIPKFDWKVSKEKQKISNFNCQKAILNYKGRIWEAWFTTDIQLQTGPYIFDGLPGLIILLKDTKKNFLFEFTALKKYKATGNENIESINVSKEQLEKLYMNYYYDPFKELKTGNSNVKIEIHPGVDSDINVNAMTLKKRAELKKFNNPIELSEIVHFPLK